MRTSVFNPLIFGLFACVLLMPGQNVYAQSTPFMYEDGLPYFFTPAEFAPLQTGTFNVVSRSVSQHPLAAINRNPAAINTFSGNGYFYADVKTLADADYLVQTNHCPPPGIPAICLPFFNEENISRQVQEPLLSTALFFRPFENAPFWAGFTYQLLKFSEPYYRTQDIIPHGPVLANAGVNREQLFGEADNFDKSGHSPALFAGYAFSDALSFGLKVNFNVYNGNGNSVSENFGRIGTVDPYPQAFEYSYWRSADYRHWDFSAGVNWNLNEHIATGFSAGFLTGRFRQAGNEFTVSDLYQEDAQLPDYFYSMDMNSQTRNGFNRDANTYYSTAALSWQLTGRSLLNFTYYGSISQQDFNFGEAHFSHRLIESNSLNYVNQWNYNYSLTDDQLVAEGAGTTKNGRHTAGLFLTREFNYGFSLTTGLQLLVFKENQDIVLDVTTNHYYKRINQTGSAPEEVTDNETLYEHSGTVAERFSLTSGYIPVIVSKSFNHFLTVDLGMQAHRQKLNRKYNAADRDELASTHFNAYGAVSVNPSEKMSIRFITFTDRRQVAHNGDMDSFRFRVVTEFHF